MNHTLIRNRLETSERHHMNVMTQGKAVVNFCSNDYLGIAQHPLIINALIEGANEYGIGSAASPIVSGYFKAHREFEEAIADYLGHERAILFSSGYAANISLLRAITKRHDMIAADKLVHASIIDGLRLSYAKYKRFPHQDFAAALALNPAVIITESIFSMEGDLTPLSKLLSLTKNKPIKIAVDTAHSFGLLPIPSVDFIITPLGKTLASMGAVISGNKDDIELILQKARAYHYSTALPPAIAHANCKALCIIKEETWRQEKLFSLIDYFIQAAKERNIPLMGYDRTPIKTILIKDNVKTMKIKDNLFSAGFLIGGIRPPTVPINTARIRISLSALHTKQQITILLDELAKRL